MAFLYENKSFFFHANIFKVFTHCSVLRSLVITTFHLLWAVMKKHVNTTRGQCPYPPSEYLHWSLSCFLWATFQTSKVLLSTKCKMYMWGNEIRIFHANITKSQGPTMYTSTTVCSLCIVKLQQRHSELVNGAITSNNNMSYLTKTLSNCHWICFTSNKEEKKKALSELPVLFLPAPSFHQVSVLKVKPLPLWHRLGLDFLQRWLHLIAICSDLQYRC